MNEGEKLKELFEKSRLSIVNFADAIGCSRRQVYNMFESEKLSPDKLQKVSEFFKYDIRNDRPLEPGMVNEPAPSYETKSTPGVKITIEFTGDQVAMQSDFIKSLEDFTRKWTQNTPQKKKRKKTKR